MAPGGPLTRYEVLNMIDEAIREYDGVNTARHAEHTEQLTWLVRLGIGVLLTSTGSLIAVLIGLMIHGK